MSTVSVTLPADGTTADVADYNTPINTIVNEFNGNIDNANIKTAAAISGSKLADNSIDLEAKVSTDTGWREVTDSWAYASATTITVPSDATTKYSVGDKIRLTQSTVKYFYITAVATTVLTINGGTDYTLTNAAISDISYSKASTPVGFPGIFSYTPAITADGGSPAIGNGTWGCKFNMQGRNVTVYFKITRGSTTSFGTGNFYISLPITASSTLPAGQAFIGTHYILDSSAPASYGGWCNLASTTTFDLAFTNDAVGGGIRIASESGSQPFAWATSDLAAGTLTYEAA